MEISRKSRAGAVGVGTLAAALFWGSTTYGQSLGDVARQERERRKLDPSTYVYTNDDLKRDRILVPEDRQRAFAARKNPSAPEIQVEAIEPPALPLPNSTPVIPAPEPEAIPAAEPVVAASLQEPKQEEKTVKVAAASHPIAHPAPKIQAEIVPSRSLRAQLGLSSPEHHRTVKHIETQHELEAEFARYEKSARNEMKTLEAVSKSSSPERRTDRSEKQTLEAISKAVRPERQEKVEPKEVAQVATVRVERGDSLWRLARLHLGSGARWRELAELNPEISDPGLIRVGDVIRLPNA